MWIVIFSLGLMIGSFLNVCVSRLPNKEMSIVFGRSMCPSCGNTLKTYHLIPVFSYIFLKGKCSFCKSSISFQYPLLELITGFLYLLLFYYFDLSFTFLMGAFLISIVLIAGIIDFHNGIIPNSLNLFLFIAGLCIQIASVFGLYNAFYGYGQIWSGFIGLIMVSTLFLLLYVITYFIYKREAIGVGDIKIFLGISLFLGWKLTLLALWLTVVSACIVMVLLLKFNKIHRKSEVPLAPFIAIGVILAIFWGYDFLDMWLFGIISH